MYQQDTAMPSLRPTEGKLGILLSGKHSKCSNTAEPDLTIKGSFSPVDLPSLVGRMYFSYEQHIYYSPGS